MAANGPLPTHLTYLTSLSSQNPGAKVRFLGCIRAYDTQVGVLELMHSYPPSSPSSNMRALVDIGVIVETMKREDLEVGAWVNVVGYVQGHERKAREDVLTINVQAIMVWGAGSVRLGQYEKAVASRMGLGDEVDT